MNARRRTLRRLAAGAAAALGLALTRGSSHAEGEARLTAEPVRAAPLETVRLDAAIPGYTGPVSALVFDAAGRLAQRVDAAMQDGAASLTLRARGALGPQWVALFAGGQAVGTWPALFTIDTQTALWTGQARFDGFVPAARALLANALLRYQLADGRTLAGYRSPDSPLVWLRDHVYQLRGARYLDPVLHPTLEHFRALQAADGSLPDVLPRPYIVEQAFRTPVEADVEYLFVQGVYDQWQVTGDDAWLAAQRDALRRALHYTLSDPLRWDAARGLVRRPRTIDTWDFEIGPTTTNPADGTPAPRHWIDGQTVWGIFHGDNTGLAHALGLMARIEERVGDVALAAAWRARAASIMANLTALSWNGRFFRHHVADLPRPIPGVAEGEQLSLSNALALNRDGISAGQAGAILDSYLARANDPARRAFAEWYSIDPPFPAGVVGLDGRSGELPGEYVNGGIMPLVGGELARGAFRHGHETYGFATLDHYWQRMLSRGRSFLWYRPDGAEGVGSDSTIPHDGWGAMAMLTALLEGAAGVIDRGIRLRDVELSPRWSASDVAGAYVAVRYAAGDGYVAYTWERHADALQLELTSSAERVTLRLLLPAEAPPPPPDVWLDGAPVAARLETVGVSRYVVLETAGLAASVRVAWQ
ncbi:MAG: hypothetical protein KGS47_04490 [Chloroflexi bacterium]|nr:hypothetical protein [Chloroflexota bacterium]